MKERKRELEEEKMRLKKEEEELRLILEEGYYDDEIKSNN